MTPEQREKLKAAALAADQNGQHIYTNPRDSNNWRHNDAFNAAASPAVVVSLIAQVEALTAGLDKIIEMNRFTAEHQYGNAEKAESWSCVTVARDALKGIHPTIPAMPGTKEAES